MDTVNPEAPLRHYEILYIIPAEYTVDELPGVQSKIKNILAEYGCVLTYEEDMGKRKLTYPIRQIHHGYYFVAEFNMDPARLSKLNESLRLSPAALRHLVVSKVERTSEQMAADKARQAKREAEEIQQATTARPRADVKVPVVAVERRTASPAPARPASKVSMEELDKKLDELIDESLL
ncbi:30S ribosomal protein S6 [Candidatus Falkowbacteria bacterium]|nr:30S ribosomal protein S6 [Candidatus Falkowbacteria bacterium]